MPEFHLIKTDIDTFKSADHDSADIVRKISQGDVVHCKSIKQRNYQFLKKFFAMMRFGFEHKPEYLDKHFPDSPRGKDNFRKEVIKAAGYYHIEVDFNGNKRKVADSISFNNMGPETFDSLYSDCLDIFCRMLQTDQQTLMDELMQFT